MIPISSLAGTARRPRIGVDFHAVEAADARGDLRGLYRDAVRRAPEFDFVFLCADPARLRDADPAFALPNARCEALRPAGTAARLGWQLAFAQRRYRLDLLHVQDRLPLVPLGPCAVTVHDALFDAPPRAPARERAARFAGRLAVVRAALVLAASEAARGEIARAFGIDAAGIAAPADTAEATPDAEGEGPSKALLAAYKRHFAAHPPHP